ncbi:uncharacterized protein K489DRAFT_130304 [Dissoconium aciculare CBS 342.82]|uniref:Uncharacterized protein n=1 Tax=Dissoconium aciculare CBS 342.82 TaxID=1314786 RepID=A0A6J3LQS3_9PEZI|nr:uncharacterized protein K489DRAFT_130304 [Dissoconium aciculare CBS 342.82]KAF1818190.1 hypothetical protein K489DRAFT_130304 [Dissoconium aciculare CBS 342.82]
MTPNSFTFATMQSSIDQLAQQDHRQPALHVPRTFSNLSAPQASSDEVPRTTYHTPFEWSHLIQANDSSMKMHIHNAFRPFENPREAPPPPIPEKNRLRKQARLDDLHGQEGYASRRKSCSDALERSSEDPANSQHTAAYTLALHDAAKQNLDQLRARRNRHTYHDGYDSTLELLPGLAQILAKDKIYATNESTSRSEHMPTTAPRDSRLQRTRQKSSNRDHIPHELFIENLAIQDSSSEGSLTPRQTLPLFPSPPTSTNPHIPPFPTESHQWHPHYILSPSPHLNSHHLFDLPPDPSHPNPALKLRRKSLSRERGHANLKADAAAGKPRIRDMAPRRRARTVDLLVSTVPERAELGDM